VNNSEIWEQKLGSAQKNGVVDDLEQNIILCAGVNKRCPGRQSSQECVEWRAFILFIGMSGDIYMKSEMQKYARYLMPIA
jgi:hypothetical protein